MILSVYFVHLYVRLRTTNKDTEMKLDNLLKGNNSGVFKNSNGEYCQIIKYYVGNNKKFQIIFSKSLTDIAKRNAIITTSEKRVLNLIKKEDFILEEIK